MQPGRWSHFRVCNWMRDLHFLFPEFWFRILLYFLLLYHQAMNSFPLKELDYLSSSQDWSVTLSYVVRKMNMMIDHGNQRWNRYGDVWYERWPGRLIWGLMTNKDQEYLREKRHKPGLYELICRHYNFFRQKLPTVWKLHSPNTEAFPTLIPNLETCGHFEWKKLAVILTTKAELVVRNRQRICSRCVITRGYASLILPMDRGLWAEHSSEESDASYFGLSICSSDRRWMSIDISRTQFGSSSWGNASR
jgi:hypothetical protein